MSRHVYSFDSKIEGADPRILLGGKGAGLNEMTRLGIPVPPGFTIATDACVHFREHEGTLPDGLEDEVRRALAVVEKRLGKKLGDAAAPLLVSVRSGARVSMPGMMDTVLNLGLTPETVEGLATSSGDRRFAFDAYRRFLQMYGDVVLGVSHGHFESALADLKTAEGNPVMLDKELSAESLEALANTFRALIEKEGGKPVPDDGEEQIWGAVRAVFSSWDNQRAQRYRRMQDIDDAWGTACTIQAMVFGNMGETSASGVAFTRNPSTGKRVLYGEYLANAQGEDVVAGIRTPQPLTVTTAFPGREDETLERAMPEAFEAIVEHCATLEAHFSDMQDVEFTIEKGASYILQTRNGKRTAHAAVRIAVDMVAEGTLDEKQAILRVDAASLDQLLHARLPPPEELEAKGLEPLARGLPASPGAATGIIVFDADEAERLAGDGTDVILVRRETNPEDIHGMKAARGIVTATGGMTSHAAVVARGLGRCCVAGVNALNVDYIKQRVVIRLEAQGIPMGTKVLEAGDLITLDGSHGLVYEGALDVVAAATVPELDTLMEWADDVRRLKVRANADTPRQARTARSYGAQGIGLCRTEHMFFAPDRLEAVRAMVLADGDEARGEWLAKIEPMQRSDFAGIFEAMDGLPVTVRLLDWPLHEFLPTEDDDFAALARDLGASEGEIRRRTMAMHEVNPMLGHRGVRVGLTLRGIYETQARALFLAALDVAQKGIIVCPEVMIPVVCLPKELELMKSAVDAVAQEVFRAAGRSVEYRVGSMIELPRACLVADQLAAHADFFSFGTNDLTQTTLGISRDDSAHFLPDYMGKLGLLEVDPFARLDIEGVGQLVRMAVERAREARPTIELGLCGEHGGDPQSIVFCHEVGLHYVSCSPPRLPIARLAAAQAALAAD